MDGIDKQALQLDGLALEYQGLYGCASGDLNVFDLVNNPAASGVCRVFGLHFTEKGGHLGVGDVNADGAVH